MNAEFGAFLTLVIQAVVAAALPILLAFAVAWLKSTLARAKTSLTKSQLFLVESGVRIFVEAAEQSGLWKSALATGAAKKAWVLEQATTWCASHGVPVDLPAIDAQIEAIVRQMKLEDAPEVTPADEQGADLTAAYLAGVATGKAGPASD